jgi:hypothetical protein
MNEEDEFISVRRLRSTRKSLETSVKHSMNDEASLGLRPVGELSETTPSHRPRKKIRRGIVWQVAYGAPSTPQGLAARPQSSNESEQVIDSSFSIPPYTH